MGKGRNAAKIIGMKRTGGTGEEKEKGGEGERSVRSRVYRDYVDFVSRKKYKNLTIERNILLDYMHKENVCDVVRML